MKTGYSPKGKILWDSWFIKVREEYHVFYLQAIPVNDPEDRHDNAVSIGHAVSEDLIHWKEFPAALERGEGEDWDNLALWTGSVIEKNNKFYMFYTGRNKSPDIKWIQKTGVATSTDLIHWKKSPLNPILEAGIYYSADNNKNKLNRIGAWRDPYVFQHPASKKYYMTLSARDKNRDAEYNGCVALAESNDLLHWKILPPVFSPGIYDEIETTQIIFHKGFYYLFFSTQAGNYHPGIAEKHGAHTGLHCYYSDHLFSGYLPVNGHGFIPLNENGLYAVRLMHDNRNDFIAMGWVDSPEDEKFTGKLSFPFTIRIENNKVYQVLQDSI